MSRAPYLLFGARAGWKFGDQKAVDAMIHDGLWCAFEDWHMGEAAEHIAAKCGVSRAEQDRFAAQSQQRAAAAWEQRRLRRPRWCRSRSAAARRRRSVSRDEGMRPETTAGDAGEAEAGLPRGRHGDGRQRLDAQRRRRGAGGRLGAAPPSGWASKPLARIVAYATSGVAPKDIFIAPVLAVRQVLEKAKLAARATSTCSS